MSLFKLTSIDTARAPWLMISVVFLQMGPSQNSVYVHYLGTAQQWARTMSSPPSHPLPACPTELPSHLTGHDSNGRAATPLITWDQPMYPA